MANTSPFLTYWPKETITLSTDPLTMGKILITWSSSKLISPGTVKPSSAFLNLAELLETLHL